MKVIHKKSIIVLIFLLISAAISAEVIELIDGTRVCGGSLHRMRFLSMPRIRRCGLVIRVQLSHYHFLLYRLLHRLQIRSEYD